MCTAYRIYIIWDKKQIQHGIYNSILFPTGGIYFDPREEYRLRLFRLWGHTTVEVKINHTPKITLVSVIKPALHCMYLYIW